MRRLKKQPHRMYPIGNTFRRMAIDGIYNKFKMLEIGNTLVDKQNIYAMDINAIKALPTTTAPSGIVYIPLIKVKAKDGTVTNLGFSLVYNMPIFAITYANGFTVEYFADHFAKDKYGYYSHIKSDIIPPVTITEDLGGLKYLGGLF